MNNNGVKPDDQVVPVQSIPKDARIKNLITVFYEEFDCKPTYFVRVPGRVNIIGEHIDYCGYPVLPMAIEQDILVAVGLIQDKKLLLRNVNKNYDAYETKLQSFEDLKIETDLNNKIKPYWYNYVLCGLKGALEYVNSSKQMNTMYGLQLVIDGNIPPAAGLSSSSALVSAACLSFLHAHNVNLSKNEMAVLCAQSERYIGTQGGGMDQAIAFLAEKYCAQYISWDPLKATAVALPKDAVFVVAHSLAESNKAASDDFNKRVMDCRLAAKILVSHNGVSKDNSIVTLSQAQKMQGKTLEEMIQLVHELLPKELYTKEDVCNILNVSEDKLNALYLTPNTTHLKEFKLKQRSLHVYKEAMRVETFRDICMKSMNRDSKYHNGNGAGESGDKEDDNDKFTDILNVLGNLMLASHESLKTLYECSHEDLDRLVDISKEINVPSRLTGAGWGGCIVALCPRAKVEIYIETLKKQFYEKNCRIGEDEVDKFVFATKPNHGAVIYK